MCRYDENFSAERIPGRTNSGTEDKEGALVQQSGLMELAGGVLRKYMLKNAACGDRIEIEGFAEPGKERSGWHEE